ncbi:MAG: PIN domain-containing protein [bacterium]
MANGAEEPVFVDSNILIYASISTSQLHLSCKRTINELVANGCELWVSRQVIREFLSVMTRDDYYLASMPRSKVLALAAEFRRFFRLAEESEAVTDRLLQILNDFKVSGKRVHDANIVATMLVCGVRRLVTSNARDFAPFAELIDLIGVS